MQNLQLALTKPNEWSGWRIEGWIKCMEQISSTSPWCTSCSNWLVLVQACISPVQNPRLVLVWTCFSPCLVLLLPSEAIRWERLSLAASYKTQIPKWRPERGGLQQHLVNSAICRLFLGSKKFLEMSFFFFFFSWMILLLKSLCFSLWQRHNTGAGVWSDSTNRDPQSSAFSARVFPPSPSAGPGELLKVMVMIIVGDTWLD